MLVEMGKCLNYMSERLKVKKMGCNLDGGEKKNPQRSGGEWMKKIPCLQLGVNLYSAYPTSFIYCNSDDISTW